MSKRVPKILDPWGCALLALCLAGCGQKGPLYLPAAPAAATAASAAPLPPGDPVAAPLPVSPASR